MRGRKSKSAHIIVLDKEQKVNKEHKDESNIINLLGILREEVRYQDNLRWKRFTNISILEGALLLLITSKDISICANLIKILFISGTFLAILISLIAIKDMHDTHYFISLVKKTEKILEGKNIEYESVFNTAYPHLLLGRMMKGRFLMKLILSIINLFNILYSLCLFIEYIRNWLHIEINF